MKEHIFKVIPGCCSGGIMALGIYNVLLLVKYFRSGRGIALLSARYLLLDLGVFSLTVLLLIAAEIVLYHVRGRNGPGEA